MPHQPRQILVVEDTDAVRLVIGRHLTLMGAVVETATDGEVALRYAHQRQFDLILTDLRMPELDGWELIHQIRKLDGYQETPIVLMTADPIDLNQLPDSFCAYAQKPLTMDTLAAILDGRLVRGQQRMYDPNSMVALDKDALREQMGKLDEDAIAMVKQFPAMMHPLMIRVIDLAGRKDYPALGEAAHSLKGAARSVGALKLGEICAIIQFDAEQDRLQTSHIIDMQNEFIRVEQEICDL